MTIQEKICIILILLCCQSCGENKDVELSTKYHSEDLNNHFIDSIEKSGIAFRVDNDGTVWYPEKYYNQINEIESVIHEKFVRNRISLGNPKDTKIFCEVIREKGYECQLWKDGGRLYVSWENEAHNFAKSYVADSFGIDME